MSSPLCPLSGNFAMVLYTSPNQVFKSCCVDHGGNEWRPKFIRTGVRVARALLHYLSGPLNLIRYPQSSGLTLLT
eukprot:scaffold2768_cov161-Amphora_coffeaeformis.AAC.10